MFVAVDGDANLLLKNSINRGGGGHDCIKMEDQYECCVFFFKLDNYVSLVGTNPNLSEKFMRCNCRLVISYFYGLDLQDKSFTPLFNLTERRSNYNFGLRDSSHHPLYPFSFPQCFFPQHLVSNIITPIFLLNTAYDSWVVIILFSI